MLYIPMQIVQLLMSAHYLHHNRNKYGKNPLGNIWLMPNTCPEWSSRNKHSSSMDSRYPYFIGLLSCNEVAIDTMLKLDILFQEKQIKESSVLATKEHALHMVGEKMTLKIVVVCC